MLFLHSPVFIKEGTDVSPWLMTVIGRLTAVWSVEAVVGKYFVAYYFAPARRSSRPTRLVWSNLTLDSILRVVSLN